MDLPSETQESTHDTQALILISIRKLLDGKQQHYSKIEAGEELEVVQTSEGDFEIKITFQKISGDEKQFKIPTVHTYKLNARCYIIEFSFDVGFRGAHNWPATPDVHRELLALLQKHSDARVAKTDAIVTGVADRVDAVTEK